MSVASDHEQLKRLLAARSVRRGEFTLASGLTSNIYVDAKLTTLHSSAMPLVDGFFSTKSANISGRREQSADLCWGRTLS